MPRALLGLGANLGNCRAHLDAAMQALARQHGLREIARSAWRETSPIGGPAVQPNYVNGAALIDTSLPPHELWRAMSAIETSAGRERRERWGPRTLDMDLLLYDEQVLDDEILTVPHPRLALRTFVLEPAAEVAPSMRHPLLGRTLGELAAHVAATRAFASILGGSIARRAELAARIANRIAAQVRAIPAEVDAPGQARALAASWQPPAPAWLLTPSWSEQPFLDGLLPVDDDVAPSLLPRLLIALDEGPPRLDPRQWPAALRQRVGPIVHVDAGDLDLAAEQAALAMQGLSDSSLGPHYEK